MKVKCINNGNMEQLALTIGKSYDAIESNHVTGAYEILIDDTGRKNMNFSKSWFEKVKEYSLVDLLDFPVGTKFYADLSLYNTNNTTIEVQENERKIKTIICNDIDEDDQRIAFTEIWAKAKYTLIEEPKPVSTVEAFKALGEGIEIQSLYSKMHYKAINNQIMSKGNHEGEEFELSDYISGGEMRGQWIIKEDSEC